MEGRESRLVLKRLPLHSDVHALNGMSEHEFYQSFNANAISASVARVYVTDSGVITMGDFGWMSGDADWYTVQAVPQTDESQCVTVGEIIDELSSLDRALPAFCCIASEDAVENLEVSPVSELVTVDVEACCHSATGYIGEVSGSGLALTFYCSS